MRGSSQLRQLTKQEYICAYASGRSAELLQQLHVGMLSVVQYLSALHALDQEVKQLKRSKEVK